MNLINSLSMTLLVILIFGKVVLLGQQSAVINFVIYTQQTAVSNCVVYAQKNAVSNCVVYA